MAECANMTAKLSKYIHKPHSYIPPLISIHYHDALKSMLKQSYTYNMHAFMNGNNKINAKKAFHCNTIELCKEVYVHLADFVFKTRKSLERLELHNSY